MTRRAKWTLGIGLGLVGILALWLASWHIRLDETEEAIRG